MTHNFMWSILCVTGIMETRLSLEICMICEMFAAPEKALFLFS